MASRPVLAVALLAATTAGGTGVAASAGESSVFTVTRTSVAPKHAFFAGRTPVTLRYLFRSAGERRDVRISLFKLGSGRMIQRWTRGDAAPGKPHRQRWHGRAREGLYGFRIGSPGHRAIPAGRVHLHGHRFPVNRAHGSRGPIGEFGAPRSGGRIHEGFDVTAPCGTPLLAIRAGRVERAGYDPQLYGHFIEVDARQSRLDYFYAHLGGPATAGRGDSVKTSERLGRIGLTGNAAGTPCHLHVELRRAGRLLDPKPRLRRWDRYG